MTPLQPAWTSIISGGTFRHIAAPVLERRGLARKSALCQLQDPSRHDRRASSNRIQ